MGYLPILIKITQQITLYRSTHFVVKLTQGKLHFSSMSSERSYIYDVSHERYSELYFITVHKRSCRKVMFSQACVKDSVHWGRVYPSMHWGRHPPGQTPPGQTPPWTDTPHQTPTGQTPQGRHPPADTPCPVHAGIHTPFPVHTWIHPPDGHCSGRYASYWNAFLFVLWRNILQIWTFLKCIPVAELHCHKKITIAIANSRMVNFLKILINL